MLWRGFGRGCRYFGRRLAFLAFKGAVGFGVRVSMVEIIEIMF